MVVLKIIADSNEHTVRSREPLCKSNYIRLLSCPPYNSLRNLKRRVTYLSLIDKQCKYLNTCLGKALGNIWGEGRGLKVTVNHSKAAMLILILNPRKKKVKLDRDLSLLLGIDQYK